MNHLIQILAFVLLLSALIPLLGRYIAKVFEGQSIFFKSIWSWPEQLTYRISGCNPAQEMNWVEYTKALILFNFFGFLTLVLFQTFQYYLPLNPQQLTGVPLLLACNTAMSFVTNTNWQSYTPETTLSYGTQMVGLASQNFLSAATGICLALALTRGVIRKSTTLIGNFWQDLTRTIVYILLPLSILFALFLVSQGVVQTLEPYCVATTLEGASQTIALGPVASQEAIKQLGTNGGGFFNANSAHPFENPTALANFFENIAIFLIPGALVYAYGIMINSRRHATILLVVMALLWATGLCLSIYSERLYNPVLDAAPLMEGKETRLGVMGSLLWSTATTATANGSVNAMHSSLSPLAGGIALFNILLGEIIFGGVGVGLCSMLMFVFLTVFLCGLMVGRTPEYLGKKIEKRDIQLVTLAILAPHALVLLGAGATAILPEALRSVGSKGPHGLTEILYAFASCAGNNGSAFAGLRANTDFYNIALSVVMLSGRLAIVVPSLALAGNLANKKNTPFSAGTFSTNSTLFALLLLSVIIIIGALTFFPALCLGPVIEHLLMLKGRAF